MRTIAVGFLFQLVLTASACSGDSTPPGLVAGDEPREIASSGDDDVSADDTDASATSTDVNFELFSSDEGAGCAIYVSVPEADATGDLRMLAWQGIVSQGFTKCGYSDVVELGVLTVNALDSYDQPDFSETLEHIYFSVKGWDALVTDCFELELSDDCFALLVESFIE